jgi:hypothetical protein
MFEGRSSTKGGSTGRNNRGGEKVREKERCVLARIKFGGEANRPEGGRNEGILRKGGGMVGATGFHVLFIRRAVHLFFASGTPRKPQIPNSHGLSSVAGEG